jgi:type 1 glutamine amidotransferase
MKMNRRRFGLGSLAALATVRNVVAIRPKRLKILVVDGINNHTWELATQAIREILNDAGRFEVEVSTTPPADAPSEAWEGWHPEFSRYDAVLSNFNSGHDAKAVLWPRQVRESFVRYVQQGGGFVSYHAANNAFLLWPEYNEMIGMGWRPKATGPSVHIGEHDEVVVVPQGQGFDPNHPKRLDFQVHVRETGHPITKGMPRVWLHPSEQLTHGQHGPVEGFTYLTYARSPVTEQNEPMDWVRRYGKGRVYVTMLGHTWAKEASPDLDCVGFQTLLARGVEWAASGAVTIPIPRNFPGPDTISLHPLKATAEAV